MSHFGQFPTTRPRRLRYNAKIRDFIRETKLTTDQLVAPLFIRHGQNIRNPIRSMPGHYQLSVDLLPAELAQLANLGLRQLLLFGIPAQKDGLGSDSYADQGIIQNAIAAIKASGHDFLIISDVCFCEYTDHGHCGVWENDTVHNDATLEILAKQAVSHATAGADIIAPSGNMDGMVGAIRKALDAAGFVQVPILSYAVKYASSLYGPFREAAEGAPSQGDRKSYQIDPANGFEALRECALDVAEGADMLMVKPAHAYLDILYQVKQAYPGLPLGAYHTSGEFAMLKAAAANGWLNEKAATLEVLTGMRRAGADFIITYYAKEVAEWLG